MQSSGPRYRVCPACRVSVRLEQPLCPECGYNFATRQRAPAAGSRLAGKTWIKWLGLGIMLAGLVRLALFLFPGPEREPPAPPPAPSALPVSAVAEEMDSPAIDHPPELSDFLSRYALETATGQDSRGYNALHLAVLDDRPELLEPLLAAGADLEVVDRDGLSPVALAVARARAACFEVLCDRQPVLTGKTPQGNLLHLAAQSGFMAALPVLQAAGVALAARDAAGNSPLHLALANSRVSVAVWFLTNNAPVAVANAVGRRPLHLAAAGGLRPVVELILQLDQDVDEFDLDGLTPLHLALVSGREETARLLLQHGASTTNAAPGGVTPLHMASYGWAGGVLSNMLDTAAGVNIRDALGYTPMDYAMVTDNKPAGVLLQRAGGRMTMAARTACAVCQGSGICMTCRGYKQVRCARCQGTGAGARQNVREKCNRCAGTGKIPGIGNTSLPCPVCRGAGSVTVQRAAPCRHCGGKAYVVCPNCGGSGACPQCAATDRQAEVDEQKLRAAEKISGALSELRALAGPSPAAGAP